MVPFFLAAWFGAASGTDAFFFSYGIIIFLANIFAPVVENVIVPFIAETRKQGKDVGKFVGGVLGVSGLLLVGLTVLLLVLTRPLLSLATRFDSSTLVLVNRLLLESAPLIVLLSWTGILSGTLNAYKRFAVPAVSPAFRALINIGCIFIFKSSLGIHSVALGYVAGEAARLIILFITIRKMGLLKIRIAFSLNPGFRDFMKKASFQAIGMVAIWSKPVIDRAMASWLGEGSVSILYYADRLYIIPITFLCHGLMATTLSHWSSRYYESGADRLRKDIRKAVWMVGIVALVIMVFLLAAHRPLVKLAYDRGALRGEPGRLAEVSKVWIYFLAGLVPYVVARIFYQGHLVLKNTRFLMVYAFCLNGLGIMLNYVLMRRMGVAGIALATTISYLAAGFGLGYFLFRKLGRTSRK